MLTQMIIKLYKRFASLAMLAMLAVSVHASTFSFGDVFVAVSNGRVQWYRANGTFVTTLDTTKGGYTTGMAFDSAWNLYVTCFSTNSVVRFDKNGALLGTFGSGYNAQPESIVFDSSGNMYVGQAAGSKRVLKFGPSGVALGSFAVATQTVGSDWIELGPDQCTLYYTSEGRGILRYNVCSATQLTDFVTNGALHGNAFALRLLPGGGMLVADRVDIHRLDAAGTIVQTYDVAGENSWFALNLDPDGTSFWSANFDTASVYKFDIATGNVLMNFNTGTGMATVYGLAVFGELSGALQNIVLLPRTATNYTGTLQPLTVTVTETVGVVTRPVVGTLVTFSVVSGPNAGVNGSSVTDTNGQASLGYLGAGGVGSDTIQAAFVDGSGLTHLSNLAIKQWVNPPCVAPVMASRPVANRGYYTLTASSGCYSSTNLEIYIRDTASAAVVGPISSGTTVRVKRSATTGVGPGAGPASITVTVKGDGVALAVDPDGRTSAPVTLKPL